MCLVKQHRGGFGEKRESGDSVDRLILVVSDPVGKDVLSALAGVLNQVLKRASNGRPPDREPHLGVLKTLRQMDVVFRSFPNDHDKSHPGERQRGPRRGPSLSAARPGAAVGRLTSLTVMQKLRLVGKE